MSRDYENEFGQDEERFRSRSRRRDADAGAGYGADSDTVPSRRQGAPGTENSGLGAEGETRRPAQDSFAGPSDGSRAAGYAGRRGTPGENGTRAAGRRVTAEGVTAEGYAARPGGSRMPGAGSTARSVGGSRTAGAGSAAGSVGGSRTAAGAGSAAGFVGGSRTAGAGSTARSVGGSRTAGAGSAAGSVGGSRTAAGAGSAAGFVGGGRTAGAGSTAGSVGGSRTAGAGSAARSVGGSRTAGAGSTAGSVGGSRTAAGAGSGAGAAGAGSAAESAGGSRIAADGTGRSIGGRVYPSPESRNGEGKGSQPRDTAFRRSGGYSAAGRKAGRETAAADPAGLQTRRRRRWIIAAIIVEVVLLCGIWTARNLIKKYNMIQRPTDFDIGKESNENLSAKKIESMKGYWTIALFGVDSRDDAVGRGNNADVIIICNINQDNGEIKLVSVFRDSYLNVDENGTYNKINQAYFTGGPKQAIKALNRNLDLQIDDFATFNWKAVADAVNILGGVDVELSKAEFHYINAFITETVEATGIASLHLKKAGMNHLDGVQAVAYARLRKMDTDFARTERQRKIIDLSFQKLKQADFAVVNNVMEVVFPQILSSITLDDVIPAAKNLTKFTIADTAGFPWARSDANMGKKGDCVIPQTLESNVIRLHQFLYGEEDYEPSDMVKQISAKISADTGMYNEGKVIDKVGTDGGYIPKPTEAPKATESPERTTGEDETESSASETDESIIDGEYDWDLELETDEYGNPIDPPEDWDYGYPGGRPNSGTGPDESGSGSRPSSGAVTPGGTTSPTDSSRYPGGTVSPTDSSRYPGGTVSPTDSSRYPGSTTSASDEVTGPGINPTRPTSPTAAYPGGTTRSTEADGPGSVIIGPGQ